ncbi:uncharacterized protein APUU_40382S [Aspergillus puulaauensis]|uniref:Cellobiose dehydrogenase-like cytochrome domain-containing protein n=1 Tax=Aspergillus puulaauensis TaxID=1220207 RepID=A0A7R7XMZ8_9EURO|nr:uncharacterized protein APUU_40382S [Aspergillus puulaauensis]BCS23938.1 hypothetical protein APUU_40382S [Aspergillus puulaauensis]
MSFTKFSLALCAILSTLLPLTTAQAPEGKPYTDPKTNITFSTWEIGESSGSGPFTFGLALPPNALKTDATEFIGYMKCAPSNGWCGVSLGGSMTNALLVVAYADQKQNVKRSLRFTSKYTLPGVYEGNATISPIASEVEKDSFTTVFRCEECLRWAQNGTEGSAATSSGNLDLAFAVEAEGPDQGCPDEAKFRKHSGQGTWVGFVDNSTVSESYESWAGKAETVRGGGC